MTSTVQRRPKHRSCRRRRRTLLRAVIFFSAVAAGLAALWFTPARAAQKRVRRLETLTVPEWVQPALLDTGGARSGQRLEDVRGIVIHYVGNPGTTAMNNRNYFAKPDTEVCSHVVVGLDGEIVQCVPLWEQAVASNARNRDTIAVEVCHPDDSGRFGEETYAAVVRLTAWLCREAGLPADSVIRHYDVTGKECPRYYVRHEDAWQRLRADIAEAI